MKTDEQRKEFEEWAALKEYSTAQFMDSDEYVYDDTTTAWESWQAAQKELTEQRDGLAEEIRLTLMENLDLCDGDICTLKRLKDAIGFDLDSLENVKSDVTAGDGTKDHG
jgi:hypothetical protein